MEAGEWREHLSVFRKRLLPGRGNSQCKDSEATEVPGVGAARTLILQEVILLLSSNFRGALRVKRGMRGEGRRDSQFLPLECFSLMHGTQDGSTLFRIGSEHSPISIPCPATGCQTKPSPLPQRTVVVMSANIYSALMCQALL